MATAVMAPDLPCGKPACEHDNNHDIRLPGKYPDPESHALARAATNMHVVERLTRVECETDVLELPECRVVIFDSTQRRDITRMRSQSHYYTEVAAGYFGATEWVRFVLPMDRWNSRTQKLRARRNYTPEALDASRARLEPHYRACFRTGGDAVALGDPSPGAPLKNGPVRG